MRVSQYMYLMGYISLLEIPQQHIRGWVNEQYLCLGIIGVHSSWDFSPWFAHGHFYRGLYLGFFACVFFLSASGNASACLFVLETKSQVFQGF